MRLLVSVILLIAPTARAATLTYQVMGDSPGPWPAILSSIGLLPGRDGVIVALDDAAAADLPAKADHGSIVIVQGASAAAVVFGFRATEKRVTVRSVED